MFSVLYRLKTNLNQVAVYSSTGNLDWREVEGGELPSGRFELQAAMVGDILHVIGGADDNDLTSILAWDQVAESWQDVGDLAVARYGHAAVAIPLAMIRCP